MGLRNHPEVNKLVPLVAVAAGLSFAAHEYDVLREPAAKHPDQVAACAQHLGPQAVQSASLPPDCEPFAAAFPYVRHTSQASIYHPDKYALEVLSGDHPKTAPAEVRTDYVLPTEHRFRQMVATAVKDWNRLDTPLLDGLAGIILTAMGAGAFEGIRGASRKLRSMSITFNK